MPSQLPPDVFSGGSSLSDGFLEEHLNDMSTAIDNLPGTAESLAFTADTKTSTYTGSVGEIALYDPSGGTFTIFFPPTPTRDDVFAIKNQNADSDAPITLDGNGNDVEHAGDEAPTVITSGTVEASFDVVGAGIFGLWKYDGTVWRIIGAVKVPDLQSMSINVTSAEKGGTAPSVVDIGTTPLIRGLRFNNTNQSISGFLDLPPDRLARFPVQLQFSCELRNIQLNGDTCDGVVDYVVTVPESDDGGVAKPNSSVGGSFTAETAKGLTPGAPYVMSFTFQPDEATNPLLKNGSLGWEFRLANTSGVGDVHMVGAELIYIK